MSKITNGKWQIVKGYEGFAIKVGEYWVVRGGCGCCNEKEDSIENEADARLIAAAPDLLEALEELASDIAERFDMESPSTNPGIKYAVEAAQKAIAKAKGG